MRISISMLLIVSFTFIMLASNSVGSPSLNQTSGGTSFKLCEKSGLTSAVNQLDGSCTVFNNSCLPLTHIKVERCAEPLTLEKIVKEECPPPPLQTERIVEKEVVREVEVPIFIVANLSMDINATRIVSAFKKSENPKFYLYWVSVVFIAVLLFGVYLWFQDYRPLTKKEQYLFELMAQEMIAEKRIITAEEFISRNTLLQDGNPPSYKSVVMSIGQRWYWKPHLIKFVHRRFMRLRLTK